MPNAQNVQLLGPLPRGDDLLRPFRATLIYAVWLSCATLPNVAFASVEYNFTQVASTSGELEQIFSQFPEMTEDGQVFFEADLPGDVQALLLGSGGPLSIVTSFTGAPLTGISGNTNGKQQTNALGEVVFRGTPAFGSEQIYHWTAGGGLNAIYFSTGPAATSFQFNFEPSINNQGDIVFNASGQGLPEAIFVGDRDGTSPAIALAATGGPLFEGFSRFIQPHIADDGTVFVLADKNSVRGIHKLTGPGTSVTIAEIGADFDQWSRFAANQSEVAFLGELSTGDRGVFVGDENGLVLVAGDDPQFRITNEPGLNDHGDVVLRGEFNPNTNRLDAIMTGPDQSADRLIMEGDLLLGQPVTQLFAGHGSINNQGQIAFFASRFDPQTGFSDSGIYLATPVPEPSALTLAACALLALAARRKRRL